MTSIIHYSLFIVQRVLLAKRAITMATLSIKSGREGEGSSNAIQ